MMLTKRDHGISSIHHQLEEDRIRPLQMDDLVRGAYDMILQQIERMNSPGCPCFYTLEEALEEAARTLSLILEDAEELEGNKEKLEKEKDDWKSELDQFRFLEHRGLVQEKLIRKLEKENTELSKQIDELYKEIEHEQQVSSDYYDQYKKLEKENKQINNLLQLSFQRQGGKS